MSKRGVTFDSLGQFKNADGERETIEKVTLTNVNGVEAVVVSYGASLVELRVPSKDGTVMENLVRGAPSGGGGAKAFADRATNAFQGATLGPVTGRIPGGEFELEEGRPVQIWSNEASGHVLHSGEESFAYQNWSLEPNCAKKHYVKFVHDMTVGRGAHGGGEEGQVANAGDDHAADADGDNDDDDDDDDDDDEYELPADAYFAPALDTSITFQHKTPPNGAWPSEVRALVTYTLTDHDELVVTHKLLNEGMRPTPAATSTNATFNLGGDGVDAATGVPVRAPPSLETHSLRVFANEVLEPSTAGDGTHTGKFLPVDGTLHSWGSRQDDSSGVAVLERSREISASQPHWPHGDCYALDHHEIAAQEREISAERGREDMAYFCAELRWVASLPLCHT